MTQDCPLVLGCATCGVTERLSVHLSLPERARPFLETHSQCVTSVDLDGTSLREALTERPQAVNLGRA